MYPRTNYDMTLEDHEALLSAMKPVPYMIIGGRPPPSQQENANAAWAALGLKMGFDPMSVRPRDGYGDRNFTAIPSETVNQREERLEYEAKEAKQRDIKRLKDEIEERKAKLDALLCATPPIPDQMRALEKRRGFLVVKPGERVWLPESEWHVDTVVSISALIVVRLVLLRARRPGSGALRRLIQNVAGFRLRPEIIQPTPRLAGFLTGLGWRHETRGTTFEDREQVWRP